MYAVVLTSLVLILISLNEVFLSLNLEPKNKELKGLKFLRRLGYIVVGQLLLFILQYVFYYDSFNFPIGVLLFFFLGPSLILIIRGNFPGNRIDFFDRYTRNPYFISFYFVLIFIQIFLTTSHFVLNHTFWYLILSACISFHLLYYAIRGFFFLRNKLNENAIKKEDFKRIKKLSYLNGFLFAFTFIILVFTVLYPTNYTVFYLFSIFYLTWFYLVISIFRWRISKSIFRMKKGSKNLNKREGEEQEIINLRQSYFLNWQISEADYLFEIILKREDKTPMEHVKNKYEKVKLNRQSLVEIDKKVKKTILEEQAFLDSNFKITDLAFKTKVSRYYLSQYFTYIHNLTFREYINLLRINAILDYILTCEEKDKLTINELFFHSAFNSKTSFFQNFKNITGMTPADYIQANLDFVDVT